MLRLHFYYLLFLGRFSQYNQRDEISSPWENTSEFNYRMLALFTYRNIYLYWFKNCYEHLSVCHISCVSCSSNNYTRNCFVKGKRPNTSEDCRSDFRFYWINPSKLTNKNCYYFILLCHIQGEITHTFLGKNQPLPILKQRLLDKVF